jgi:hypothetical protein
MTPATTHRLMGESFRELMGRIVAPDSSESARNGSVAPLQECTEPSPVAPPAVPNTSGFVGRELRSRARQRAGGPRSRAP